ncbi:MAG: shikimate dehydrogenase [Actinobacteria bacterium]|nr:shikimate dehydrogenase [Actinomycetota bacterium]MCL6105674.1 shikimate dehydrogenase [Actinomycetota bacterium]
MEKDIWPTAKTKIAGVIGYPIDHSLSPLLHNAAFQAVGLDWVYVAFQVPEGKATSALGAVRTMGIHGLSVTMPHKQAIIDGLDSLSPTAEHLLAVNTVLWHQDKLIGDNTDVGGFIDTLARGVPSRQDFPTKPDAPMKSLDEPAEMVFDPGGKRCIILGGGGAAKAVAMALALRQAAEIVVVNRTLAHASQVVAIAGRVGRLGRLEEVADADLVVNATSVGMDPLMPDLSPVDKLLFHEGQVVVDLVYNPIDTVLLRQARSQGAYCITGVSMLVYQAARAFEMWTGVEAPLYAMWKAVEDLLGGY